MNIVDLKGEPHGEIRFPVDTLMFHLPRAALDEVAEDAGAAKIARLTAPDPWKTRDPIVEQMHGLIVEALAAPTHFNRLLLEHVMLGLGAHFAFRYGGLRAQTPLLIRGRLRGGLAPWQERRAKELLANGAGLDVSLLEIASECGLSVAHFSRAFKVTTGVTPYRWLQMERIRRAKQLLASRMSLAEIALALGFADQSHFTRVFAQSVGCTPGSWRQSR